MSTQSQSTLTSLHASTSNAMEDIENALYSLQSKTLEALNMSRWSRAMMMESMLYYCQQLQIDAYMAPSAQNQHNKNEELKIIHVAGTKGKGSDAATPNPSYDIILYAQVCLVLLI